MSYPDDHSQTVKLMIAAHELGILKDRFRVIDEDEAEPIIKELEHHFVREPGRTWWWEAFREMPNARAGFYDSSGWSRLTRIAPADDSMLWFVVEDDTKFVLCEGSIDAIVSVIGECESWFEYYIISKAMEWLICETHHDVIYALGLEVAARLNEIAIHLPEKVRQGHHTNI